MNRCGVGGTGSPRALLIVTHTSNSIGPSGCFGEGGCDASDASASATAAIGVESSPGSGALTVLVSGTGTSADGLGIAGIEGGAAGSPSGPRCGRRY